MNLLGLSPAVYAAGLGVLVAALLGLHLLRVRTRRVEVESLWFYALVSQVRRPLVLGGRPARWLAFLLALLLGAALWTGYCDPVLGGGGASRVVLVDGSGTAHGARLAQRLAHAGDLAGTLGPRGAVLAFGGDVTLLLRSGEARTLLHHRARRLVASGPGSAWPDALRTARGMLQAGDEILVLGGPAPAPATVDGVAVCQVLEPADAAAGVHDLALDPGPELALRVAVHGPATAAALAVGGHVLHAPVQDGEAVFRGIAATGSGTVTVGGAQFAVAWQAPPPLRVWRPDGLPLALRLALAADPTLVASDDPQVQLARDELRDQGVPALLVVAGEAPAPRDPRATDACPLALGLRNRRTAQGTRLPHVAGQTVWVEDALTGDALVAFHREVVSGRGVARLHVVGWLLDEAAHRDVPRLLLGGLHALAPRPRIAVAGERYVGLDDAGRAHTLATGEGVALAAPAAGPGAAAEPIAVAGSSAWWWPLGLLALALLATDLCLYHKGRVP